ncbi:MAG: DUF4249 domain-containing protein [Dysgonamonadaceae bacterium]|nr:DUF4249 domain-containing protein [Dysgonamonadaceae bacterium]
MNKIQNMFRRFSIVTCALLAGCGQELMNYDIDTETPVVESYLQEGATSLTVKVYTMEVYLKDGIDVSDAIGGLSIKVNGRELTETVEGTYVLDLGTDTLRQGQAFDLNFDYGGRAITASTTVPEPVRNLQAEPTSLAISSSYYWSTEDSTAVTVTWDDPDGSYYQVYILSPNTSDMPSMGVFGRRMMQPFKGNSYKASGMEFRSTGWHTIYVYRVNKDYAELYEQVSSTDLANPISFIDNAFGIFTAMSVARVGIYVYEEDE